jgi:hypothetical protein
VQIDYDPTSGFAKKVHETVNLLARSEVAVYPIGANGVETTPMGDASAAKYSLNVQEPKIDNGIFEVRLADSEETMKRIAGATGGKAFLESNDLGQATARALKDGADYYEIAYAPGGEADGGYRKIEVRVSAGAYSLSYRDGYYAEPLAPAAPQPVKSTPPGKPESAMDDAAARIDFLHRDMQHGAPDPTQILFKVILVASGEQSKDLPKGNIASTKCKPPYRVVTAAYAANPGDVTMPPGPNGSREVALQFVVLVFDADGKAEVSQADTVHVFVKPGGYEQFLKEGIRIQQQIAVPAKGDHFVRVGIHDLIGDKAGAIEVPAASIAVAGAQAQ